MRGKASYILILLSVGITLLFLLKGLFEYQFLSINRVQVGYEIEIENDDTLGVSYDVGPGWNSEDKVTIPVKGSKELQEVVFPEIHRRNVNKVRLDLGRNNEKIVLRNVFVTAGRDTIKFFDDKDLLRTNCLTIVNAGDTQMSIETNCDAPHIIYNEYLSSLEAASYSAQDKTIVIILIAVYCLILLLIYRKKIAYAKCASLKVKEVLFVLFFVGFVFSHWLITVGGYKGVDFTLEKRFGEPLPDFGDTNYVVKFEKWFEDQMAFRQEFTKWKSYQDYWLFDKSALPEKTVMGKNKELYPAAEFILDDFLGKMVLNEAQLFNMKNHFLEKVAYLKSKEIDFYLVLPPSKQTIYPNDLPAKYAKRYNSDRRMLHQLMEYLKTDSTVLEHLCNVSDLLLSQSKSKQRLYYKSDMHWNSYGAYYGYLGLMNKMSERHPELKPYKLSDFEVKKKKDLDGDLARLLMLQESAPRQLYEFETTKATPYGLTYGYEELATPYYHSTNDGQEKKVVVFRDSFFQNMMQFFSLHFNEVHYVWDHHFDIELIEREKPDIVVFEVTEIFIYDLLILNPEEVREKF